MVGQIQAPVFFQYTNGGLVAFETVFEAENNVPVGDFANISGAWDVTGQRVEADPARQYSTRLYLVESSGLDSANEFRAVLEDALSRTDDVDVTTASLRELSDRAYWRFSLLDESVVNTGCFIKWLDAALTFLHLAPR